MPITDEEALALAAGTRIYLSAKPKGWTKYDRAAYGGRSAVVASVHQRAKFIEILATVESGPVAGERRWFRPAEVEVVSDEHS